VVKRVLRYSCKHTQESRYGTEEAEEIPIDPHAFCSSGFAYGPSIPGTEALLELPGLVEWVPGDAGIALRVFDFFNIRTS